MEELQSPFQADHDNMERKNKVMANAMTRFNTILQASISRFDNLKVKLDNNSYSSLTSSNHKTSLDNIENNNSASSFVTTTTAKQKINQREEKNNNKNQNTITSTFI